MNYPALMFSLLYIIARMVFFYLGFGEDYYKYLVSLNLFFIILIIAFTLYNNYKQDAKGFFPNEIKSTLRSISVYAIILAGFMFFYYKVIDPGFFDRKMDVSRMEMMNTDFTILPDTENPLKTLGLSKEEFIENQMTKLHVINTPFAWSTFTLMGIIITGLIYSLIMVFLRLKLLPRLFRK